MRYLFVSALLAVSTLANSMDDTEPKLGIRQTDIVGEPTIVSKAPQCTVVRFFSVKEFSSISTSLERLKQLNLLGSGVSIIKEGDWYFIQAADSNKIDNQQLETIKQTITDAQRVKC